MVDMSYYKNETININFYINSLWKVINSFELLIYYSDYKNTFSIINEENSYSYIPSIINHQYYIFVDLDKAYDNIFLYVETSNITKFSGKYYLYESNKIQEIIDILPDSQSKDGIDITSYPVTNYLYEIKIIKNIKYDKSVLFQINTSQNAKFKVRFFKAKYINTFNNITFNLSINQKYIIYYFYNPKDDFIYTYVKKGNISSTEIYFYNNFYDIYIDKNNRVLNYNEKYNLNSNIFKFYAIKGHTYILFSNFEENYSDVFYVINPYEYYDITQYETFQFFYKIINQENNMIFTLSFNNRIKKKNFLNYQIYNYQKDQIDNTQIYENDTVNKLSIDHLDYGGIINITNNKNSIIKMTFNVSSLYTFDSIIISLYFSNYKNLYNISSDKNGYFYVPSVKKNDFYILADITNIQKKVIFTLETEIKEISDKYYFYNTSDIDEIYSNLPNDESYNYDGYYKSRSIGEKLLEINVDKNNSIQKSVLLKMSINTNTNFKMINYEIYDIKPMEIKSFELNYDNYQFIIFRFDNQYTGEIYISLIDTSYSARGINVTLFYDIYKININKVNHQIVNYKIQKQFTDNNLLIFPGYIGQNYFLISDKYKTNFAAKISILNNNGYNDITDYEIFQYIFKFDSTDNIVITFSFKNDIKQKNFLYYQIKDNLYAHPLRDNSIIKTKTSQRELIIDKNNGVIDVSNFKNETINIQINVKVQIIHDIIKSLQILIFYSDYKNLFFFNPLENNKNNTLVIYSIREKDFYIFINITRETRELYLNTNYSKLLNIKPIDYYLYKTNQIKEIENHLSSSFIPYKGEYTREIESEETYNIVIKRPESTYKSVVINITTNNTLELKVNYYKKLNIKTYRKTLFKLNDEKNYIIYEYDKNDDSIYNHMGNKLYIYFEGNSSNSLQVDIYRNYSDINIDEFNKKVIKSDVNLKMENRNFVELDDFNEKNFIIVSDFLKDNDSNNNDYNSIQVVRTGEYYDITPFNIFAFNFKFKRTTEKRILSF